MNLDWPNIRDTLRTLVETISGVPGVNVQWADENEHATVPQWSSPGGSTENGVRVELSIFGFSDVGQPEVVQDFDEGEDRLDLYVRTQHRFTLRVEVKSFSHKALAERFLAEIGTGIAWPSSLDTLRAVGLAFSVHGESVDQDYVVNERTYNRAYRDVTLLTSSSVRDRGYEGHYIKRFEIEGAIEGRDPETRMVEIEP